ncbi:MAG TPA: hypothetical protein VN963_02270, partial [bacterium]|nr:hypothetical protein [bacterium]
MKKIIFFLSLLFTSTLMLVTACGHNPVSPLESTSTPTTGTSNSTSTATNTLTNTPTNTASGPTATFT